MVDSLLPSSGLSALLGKPKAGKSTLARQLITCVAQGEDFLGRRCEQGGVIYFALEEKEGEVIRHFRELGLRKDDPVQMAFDRTGISDPVASLNIHLRQMKDVRLVVIDTLFRFVSGIKDANDYLQVMRAMDPLMAVARVHNAHIMTLHHQKKNESDDLIDNVLGSTALAGGVDTLIGLAKAKTSEARTIASRQRYSVIGDMEPTQLVFDKSARRLSLGISAAELQSQNTEKTENRILKDIITYVREHPGCTQEAVMEAVTGNVALKKRIFRSLTDEGELLPSGKGVKGDPFAYTLKPLADEI